MFGNRAIYLRWLDRSTGFFFATGLSAAYCQVIHDWNDRESVQILSSIRRSAPSHANLLLIEAILPKDATSGWIEMVDIFMLALITGRERTRREFETLLNSSGFRLDKVIDVGLDTSILEASVI